jgi:nucleotide-binding universal stress UspA family protein
MAHWKKVCCAVDFSEMSRVTMEEAADVARRYEAELTLLHVFDTRPIAQDVAPDLVLEKFEKAGPELERMLGAWAAQAARISGGEVRSALLTGFPATEIVRFARDGHYDLVVMGTHGRTGLSRLVLGSVAEHTVRDAHCPVLVVRPQRS